MKQAEDMRPGSRYWRPAGKLRTLRDLAVAKVALVAVCRRCHHQKLLFPYGLAERLGQDFPVEQLAARLRCTECQALGWVRVRTGLTTDRAGLGVPHREGHIVAGRDLSRVRHRSPMPISATIAVT